jgi:hypothetical protein
MQKLTAGQALLLLRKTHPPRSMSSIVVGKVIGAVPSWPCSDKERKARHPMRQRAASRHRRCSRTGRTRRNASKSARAPTPGVLRSAWWCCSIRRARFPQSADPIQSSFGPRVPAAPTFEIPPVDRWTVEPAQTLAFSVHVSTPGVSLKGLKRHPNASAATDGGTGIDLPGALQGVEGPVELLAVLVVPPQSLIDFALRRAPVLDPQVRQDPALELFPRGGSSVLEREQLLCAQGSVSTDQDRR